MYSLILKLLIRTRLSRYYLLFLGIIALIDVSVSFSGIGPAAGTQPQSLGGAVVLLFFYYIALTAVTLLGNGLGMTKPDSDFLLPSSIRGRTLNYALFTVQFISISIIFIILSISYTVGSNGISADSALVVMDFLMLGISLTSISVIVSDFGMPYRVLVFAVISAYILSFIAGFQYSPFAFYRGHIETSTIGTAVLFAVTLIFALRWVNTNDLYVKNPRRISIMKKDTFKDRLTFLGMSPEKAIFRQYFMHFYSGRPVGMSGSVVALSYRYRLKATLPLMAGISAAVVAGVHIYRPQSATDIYPVLIILIVYLSFVVNYALYGNSFSVERLWLTATSMPYFRYVKGMISAQALQAAVLELPLGVAIAILGILYGPILLPLIIAVEVITPEAVAIMSSLNIVSKPPQSWENAIMVRRVGLKRIMLMLPYATILLSGLFISILYPIGAVVEAVVLAVLVYAILTRKNYWEGMVSKLAESSFI